MGNVKGRSAETGAMLEEVLRLLAFVLFPSDFEV